MIGKTDDIFFLQDFVDRIVDRPSCLFIQNLEDAGERLADAAAEVQPVSCSAIGFRYETRPSASVAMTPSPMLCRVTLQPLAVFDDFHSRLDRGLQRPGPGIPPIDSIR
jgi:hypothetical protein